MLNFISLEFIETRFKIMETFCLGLLKQKDCAIQRFKNDYLFDRKNLINLIDMYIPYY